MKLKILQFINCKILGMHNWTSAAEKGLQPSYAQLKSMIGMWDYAKMYCDDCGHIYKESLRLMQNARI